MGVPNPARANEPLVRKQSNPPPRQTPPLYCHGGLRRSCEREREIYESYGKPTAQDAQVDGKSAADLPPERDPILYSINSARAELFSVALVGLTQLSCWATHIFNLMVSRLRGTDCRQCFNLS